LTPLQFFLGIVEFSLSILISLFCGLPPSLQ
jgi:hypothetical protein